jgi:hypothetical protein
MRSAPSSQVLVPTPAPYRRFARIRGAGLLGVLLAVTGCEQGANLVAPSDPLASSAVVALPAGWARGGNVSVNGALMTQLLQEQDRTRREEERSRGLFQVVALEYSRGPVQNSSKESFLWCSPLKYAAESQIIGPEGGEIDLGAHKLAIPAGALAEPTVITAEIPVSTVAAVKFSPHGLQFAKPAVLTLNYGHCSAPAGVAETAAYFDEDHNVLEWPATTVHGRRAEVQIWHFSQYGMASGRK